MPKCQSVGKGLGSLASLLSLSSFQSARLEACLLNENADAASSREDDFVPPGALFDTDHQCRLKFGRQDAVECPYQRTEAGEVKNGGEFCKELWLVSVSVDM